MTQNHEHLEKLIWDMQDTLDELVSESLRQVDCLDEIEGLFDYVQKAAKKQGGKAGTEPPTAPESIQQSPRATPVLEKREVERAEKATQCNEFLEDVFSLALLEERHCQYMFEVFSHLRFCVELITPYEIDRPHKSKPMPLSNSTE